MGLDCITVVNNIAYLLSSVSSGENSTTAHLISIDLTTYQESLLYTFDTAPTDILYIGSDNIYFSGYDSAENSTLYGYSISANQVSIVATLPFELVSAMTVDVDGIIYMVVKEEDATHEIYRCDPTVGDITPFLKIGMTLGNQHGLEISEDKAAFYFCDYEAGILYKMDVASGTSTPVAIVSNQQYHNLIDTTQYQNTIYITAQSGAVWSYNMP